MINFGTDDQDEVESNSLPPEILEDPDDGYAEDIEETDDEIAEDDEVVEKDSL